MPINVVFNKTQNNTFDGVSTKYMYIYSIYVCVAAKLCKFYYRMSVHTFHGSCVLCSLCIVLPTSDERLSFIRWNDCKCWIRRTASAPKMCVFRNFCTGKQHKWWMLLPQKECGEFTCLREYNCVSGTFRLWNIAKKANNTTDKHWRFSIIQHWWLHMGET